MNTALELALMRALEAFTKAMTALTDYLDNWREREERR